MLSTWIKGRLSESSGSECQSVSLFTTAEPLAEPNTDDSNHSSDQMHLTPHNCVDIKQKASVQPAHTRYMKNTFAGFITQHCVLADIFHHEIERTWWSITSTPTIIHRGMMSHAFLTLFGQESD